MFLRRGLILTLLAAIAAAAVFAYAGMVTERSGRLGQVDFSKFYLSADALIEGGDIYGTIPIERLGPIPTDKNINQNDLHPNLNLPIVSALFKPFLLTDIATAFVIWSALSLVFVFGTVLPLIRTFAAVRVWNVFFLWLALLHCRHHEATPVVRSQRRGANRLASVYNSIAT